MRAAYYAAVSFVDFNAGRILQHLRQTGELDNTLVIWTADHGEMLGDYGSYGKRTMLDAACCIPMVVRYPAAFGRGERCDRLASLVDVMPTCLEQAGVPVPESAVGVDLAALSAGQVRREGIVSQFDEGTLGLYSLIREDYKYIYSAPDQREWLFDRRHRPEERSLIGVPGYEAVVQQMRRDLIARLHRDGHDAPLDGEAWKACPKQQIPADPDWGLLFQEGGPVEHLFPEGYRPRT
jgi:arylsulfatase A-like enzyme